MFKKLEEEKINEIMDTGISQFALKGIDKANINEIAKLSGVSVGVIYKYFETKENFFLECVRYSVSILEGILKEAVEYDGGLMDKMEMLIRAVQKCSTEYKNYSIVYHEITAGSSRKYAKVFAQEIESITGKTYGALIKQAQLEGIVRDDCDERTLAFFFDNLLLMLQFSYSCDYYKERFRIYCGEDIVNDEELVVQELMRFLKAALQKRR